MLWPKTPVEQVARFRPPHCPWPQCADHYRQAGQYRYHRHGSYETSRRRNIPRFRCQGCRRTFSRQTFSTSYYCKRFELLRPIAAGIVAGSAQRQLARSLGCSPTTVARISARLGRHAMLLHTRCLSHLAGRLNEAIVLDHFETFEFTQDYPFGVATPVGQRSWFVYGLDPAPHGRTGRRSVAQQRRLEARPKRSSHGGYAGSTRRTMNALLALTRPNQVLSLVGDAHPAYARTAASHARRKHIHLRSYANPARGPKGTTRSREAIERDREMFAADLFHKLVRHSMAHNRRETIAFPRRKNAELERLFVMVVWRNLVKGKSERRSRSPTPAMHLGLTAERWNWARVLSRRLFFHRQPMPEPWPRLYRRGWTTPVFPRNARHDCKHAF